jgi:hypothetical protein
LSLICVSSPVIAISGTPFLHYLSLNILFDNATYFFHYRLDSTNIEFMNRVGFQRA